MQESKTLTTLALLATNARMPTKDIAQEIRTSQQNASHLIKKLEEDGTIHSYRLLVDASRFGYSNFCVFLRLRNFSKHIINQLTEELQNHKEITAIEFLFGNYDLFLRFTSPNASNFNKSFKEFFHAYSNEITDYVILTQIVTHFYAKQYLSGKRKNVRHIIAGDRDQTPIDALNYRITNLLNRRARIPFSSIATQTQSTSKTIIARTKQLQNQKIIKGYSLNLNHKKLNILRYHLLLSFDFLDEEQEKSFMKFCEANPHIVEIIKVFGDWDDILIIETFSSETFKKIFFTLKEQFSEVLMNYTFHESEGIKRWRYLPEFTEDDL